MFWLVLPTYQLAETKCEFSKKYSSKIRIFAFVKNMNCYFLWKSWLPDIQILKKVNEDQIFFLHKEKKNCPYVYHYSQFKKVQIVFNLHFCWFKRGFLVSRSFKLQLSEEAYAQCSRYQLPRSNLSFDN